MAKVILICGKIASGKSVYSRRIVAREHAVLLSVDELVLSVFGGDLGEKHDEITARVRKYLLDQSVKMVNAGVNVVLDWGFWTKESRREVRRFYAGNAICCEFHYVDTPNDVWRKNIEIRNRAVLAGEVDAYFVDESLLEKLEAAFEVPAREEIDVWHVNDWR